MTNICGDFSSLAVSGQCSSGKSTLCKILSKSLNWKHVDVGNEFRKIAKYEGLEIEKFGSISDELLRHIDEQIRQRIQTEENMIWDGRLTCYFTRSNGKVFKVYCMADLPIRAGRCANRDKMNFEEATRKVLARDKEEASVFRRLYGFSNPFSTEWMNLKLDTSAKSSEVLANMVMQALHRTDMKSV